MRTAERRRMPGASCRQEDFRARDKGGDEIQERPITALAYQNIKASVKLRIGKVEMLFALSGNATASDHHAVGAGLQFFKLCSDILSLHKFQIDAKLLGI